MTSGESKLWAHGSCQLTVVCVCLCPCVWGGVLAAWWVSRNPLLPHRFWLQKRSEGKHALKFPDLLPLRAQSPLTLITLTQSKMWNNNTHSWTAVSGKKQIMCAQLGHFRPSEGSSLCDGESNACLLKYNTEIMWRGRNYLSGFVEMTTDADGLINVISLI